MRLSHITHLLYTLSLIHISGVVPLGADMRAWRQMNGLLCRYLSGEAARVSRLFCGLEERLK